MCCAYRMFCCCNFYAAILQSFTEMNKMMLDNWKVMDEVTKSVFLELAKEGREEYAIQKKKYEDEKKHLTKSSEGSIKPSPDKKPKFPKCITSREVSSVSTEVKSSDITVDSSFSSRSDSVSELDWEPLQIHTQPKHHIDCLSPVASFYTKSPESKNHIVTPCNMKPDLWVDEGGDKVEPTMGFQLLPFPPTTLFEERSSDAHHDNASARPVEAKDYLELIALLD